MATLNKGDNDSHNNNNKTEHDNVLGSVWEGALREIFGSDRDALKGNERNCIMSWSVLLINYHPDDQIKKPEAYYIYLRAREKFPTVI